MDTSRDCVTLVIAPAERPGGGNITSANGGSKEELWLLVARDQWNGTGK